MTHLTVVIPVYNESTLIEELVKRVKLNVKLITEDFEIIIIDDGSKDQTWSQIEIEAKKEKRIKGIKFSRNFGHHYAITAGLHNSSGEWTVVMDGDLQDRPEVIPDLYKKAVEGFDIIYVSRKGRPESKFYLLAQRLFYIILNAISGLKFDYTHANFSIINSKVLKNFNNLGENTRFYPSTIKWVGFKEGTIFAQHGERFSGTPGYTFKKRIRLATEIIISQSNRPLKFVYFVGTIEVLTSLLFLINFIFKVEQGTNILENGSLIVFMITFIGGTITLGIGIIGTYIGKIFIEAKQRPLYVVDKFIN